MIEAFSNANEYWDVDLWVNASNLFSSSQNIALPAITYPDQKG